MPPRYVTMLRDESTYTITKSCEEENTCAQFGKHLHGVIKSLLAKQIEGVEILDVMYLLLLIAV